MLNNQQGFIVGQKDMTLNAGTLDNRQGVLGVRRHCRYRQVR
ncbi:hypothetical protein N5T16_18575 [Escherichia coli]|nr:hypothetical protein [Escherichia coli]MCW3280828.1 hypothetical protein [Escherichia coli]